MRRAGAVLRSRAVHHPRTDPVMYLGCPGRVGWRQYALVTIDRARVLHGQLVELLEAARSGELPVGPAFRHRLEGGITALEAVLGMAPSLGTDVFTPPEHHEP